MYQHTNRFIYLTALVLNTFTSASGQGPPEINLNQEEVAETRRPCETMSLCDLFDMFDRKYISLERRVRSLEQPSN